MEKECNGGDTVCESPSDVSQLHHHHCHSRGILSLSSPFPCIPFLTTGIMNRKTCDKLFFSSPFLCFPDFLSSLQDLNHLTHWLSWERRMHPSFPSLVMTQQEKQRERDMDGNIKRKKKKSSSCWTKRDEGMGLKLPTRNLLHRKKEGKEEWKNSYGNQDMNLTTKIVNPDSNRAFFFLLHLKSFFLHFFWDGSSSPDVSSRVWDGIWKFVIHIHV